MKTILLSLAILLSFVMGFITSNQLKPKNPYDINQDGAVDIKDLSVFLAHYPEDKPSSLPPLSAKLLSHPN